MDIESIYKGISVFRNIKYYDEPHAYFIGDEQVISVTGFIKGFEDEFEEEKWLKYKAKEKLQKEGRDVTAEALGTAKAELKAEWTYKKNHGTLEGSLFHGYMEGLMANKEVEDDANIRHGDLSLEDVKDTYYMLKRLGRRFYEENVMSGKLVPAWSELVVGDAEVGLAGQIDQIFWNTELDCFQLMDWKTNRKLDRTNKYSTMKYCLNRLESCEYIKYSLQLSTYKYLFEKNTGMKLNKDFYIIWFNELNPKPEVIKAMDLTEDVLNMIDFKRKNPEFFKPNPYVRPSLPEPAIKLARAMDDLLTI